MTKGTGSNINAICSQVLKRVVPTAEETKKTNEMSKKISAFIENKYKLPARLMGSSARETDMRGDKDLDIFIFFPTNVSRGQLEKRALQIGKAVFKKFGGKYVIDYAEHPYTKGTIEGFRVEIVPAYDIKALNHRFTSVDRTPFHNEWVRKNLKPGQTNEVRLLKKFLDAAGCYGSDLKTQGFSGYLCELIIIKYGFFAGALKAMQNWTYQQFVDIEEHHVKAEHERLKKNFEGQPLIFIDPVDKNRNVAAVLSKERLALAIFTARQFLEKPTAQFFEPRCYVCDKRKILANIKTRNTDTLAIIIKKPKLIEDILYPQLRRFEKALVKALREADFEVLDSWIFGDVECGVGLEILITTLPTYKIVRGPPIFSPKGHQDAFLKKYKKVWFIDDRFVAEVEREYPFFEGFLVGWLSGNAKQLQLKGVPPSIAEKVAKGFSLVEDMSKIKSDEFWRGIEKERIK